MNYLYAIMGIDDDGHHSIIAICVNGQVLPCVSGKIELINDLMSQVVKEKVGSGVVFEIVRFTRDMIIERVVA